MSIKYNGKTIAGGYTPPYATDNIYGITRIATDDELKEGLSKTTCITPYQLSNHGEKVFSNVSLSNLDIEGEKHFINKSQITNCLLEVPQRIKYDLTDGTLTIKAGSVVIVPYGTEDKTSEFPVGSTFIRDNFKVYDTQFADGKFFVWAELVGDVLLPSDPTTDTNLRSLCLVLTIENGYNLLFTTGSGSGYTGTTNNVLYYNTSKNVVERYNNTNLTDSEVRSFPLMLIQADGSVYLGSVNQVFNGVGKIGSIYWIDKGVTALSAKGKNQDGSINNVARITEKLEFLDNSAWDAVTKTFSGYLIYINCEESNTNTYIFQPYERFMDSLSTPHTTWVYAYIEHEQQWYFYNGETDPVWRKADIYIYANMTTKDGELTPKQPIRLVDSDNIDGQVVYCGDITIFNTTTIGSYTIDLSSYVPIDGHGYDLYICCAFGPDNSSDRHDRQVIIYDGTNTSTILARFTYDVANSQVEIPTIIPLSASAQSKITVKLHSSNSVPFSRAIIYLHAMRRRGNSI